MSEKISLDSSDLQLEMFYIQTVDKKKSSQTKRNYW